MTVNALSAANAYRNQLKMQQGIEDAVSGDTTGQSPFSQMLSNSLHETAETLHQADALKMESLTGKVELSDLVTSINSAELTLNTVVAVRDKIISAYQDILRMPI